jgi:hypothetical protein
MVAVPFPVRLRVAGEFEASLKNETTPFELPPTCGENDTVKETVRPEGTVTGNVIPLKEKPLPFQEADDTVTFSLPAESVPFCDLLVPTATLPKLMLPGVDVS